MAKEEVELEVEAAQAVYGDDCVVLDKYPPHLHIHVKPRTADVSSQQFVEAVIGMRAGPQYPDEPPHITIIDSKGLDEQRQQYLITTICEKASELTSYQMLVALCEEAVDQLSNMNHPDGDCPLCLTPLVDEDGSNKSLPFMKLMSCFHCFHGECIIRWWNWLQLQNETDSSHTTSSSGRAHVHGILEKCMGRCPVCRKVFIAKDIEHVLDLVGTTTSLDDSRSKFDDEKILHSDSEIIRRQKFDAILKIQQERSGLIEPKKNEVLLPGMYLPRPVASPMEVLDAETVEVNIHSKASTPSSSNNRSQRSRNTNARRKKGPLLVQNCEELGSNTNVRKQGPPFEQNREEPGGNTNLKKKGPPLEQNREELGGNTNVRYKGPPLEQNRKEQGGNARDASRPSTSKDRSAKVRKEKGTNPKPQQRQWVRKENDPTS